MRMTCNHDKWVRFLLEAQKCFNGGTGRHAGLKILFALKRVRVRFPLGVQ